MINTAKMICSTAAKNELVQEIWLIWFNLFSGS